MISKYSYKLYDISNKWDYECFLKTGIVLAEVSFVGRLFQRCSNAKGAVSGC